MKSIGLFVLSWAIVALGQPAWSPWLAPIAACIGYALFWKVAAQIPFSKKRFWIGALWFGAVQLIQLSWMTSIQFQGFYILFVYFAVVLWLGLQFGLVTLFVDKIPLVATAALWTLLEWTRLFVLCGFSWNPVGLCLTAFSFSMQAASLFGIFGLSFLVVLTNLAFWKKRYKVATLLAIFPYAFGALHTSLHESKINQSGTMTVGLVQTGLMPSQKILIEGRFKDFIPPSKQWQRIVNLLKSCDQPLDLVVLPEFSVPNTAGYDAYPSSIVRTVFQEAVGPEKADALNIDDTIRVSNQFWVQAIGKVFKTDIIAGLEAEEGGLHFTSAFYCRHQELKVERGSCKIPVPQKIDDFDASFQGQQAGPCCADETMPEWAGEEAQREMATKGRFSEAQESCNCLERYDKQILVPLGEYIPFEWVKALTRAYGVTEFFTHGNEAKVFASKVPLSASICYEETFSHLMRQNRQKGASMFVNLTNDNWYPNSKLPQQHFDHARLRAVENGVPMVRACNTGVTAAVDSLGRIIGQITEETRADVLVAKIPLYHYSTFYSFWGDWGIVSISVFFILICFYFGGFKILRVRSSPKVT